METKLFQVKNFKMHIRDNVWDENIVSGEFQEDNYFPPSEMKVAVDIGAHIGGSSIYFASKGAEVYAYEPDKDNFELLVKNVKENGFEDKIHCFNLAVGSASHININTKNSGMNGAFTDGEKEEVKSISLDEVLADIPECDLLKVDCEGGEYDFFPTSDIRTLKKVKQLSLELHYCTEGHRLPALEERFGKRYAEDLVMFLGNFFRFDVRNSPAASARFYIGHKKYE